MDQFSIVFVCSGNRFRSPLAEVFVHRLTLGLPVSVQSFGTLRLGPAPALDEAAELGLWCGVDLSRHRARLVGAEPLEQTDLVVGFDQDHVRRAVTDAGADRRRSFRFREIVSLLRDADDAETGDVVRRARKAVAEAAERRDADSYGGGDEPIRDPYGSSWRVYRETAAEIRELSIALVVALFGIEARGLPPLPAKVARRR